MSRLLAAAAWITCWIVTAGVMLANELAAAGVPYAGLLARSSLVGVLVFTLPLEYPEIAPTRTYTGTVRGDLSVFFQRDIDAVADDNHPLLRVVRGGLELPLAIGLYARFAAHYFTAELLARQQSPGMRVTELPDVKCRNGLTVRVCVSTPAFNWQERFLMRAVACSAGATLYLLWTPFSVGLLPTSLLAANTIVLCLDPIVGVWAG